MWPLEAQPPVPLRSTPRTSPRAAAAVPEVLIVLHSRRASLVSSTSLFSSSHMTLVLVTRFREHFEPLRIRLVAQIVQPIDFIGAGGVTNSATLGPFSYSWFPCVIYNDLVTAHLQTIMFPNV